MTAFNVLDRKEKVHRHLFLEASAGTGKTFAIENMIVRLLLELDGKCEPMPLEKILVVTFTRMAAADLKERVHANLEKALSIFKEFLLGRDVKKEIPDYLLSYLELGDEVVKKSKKFLESALFSFDCAQIFTIHSFCWRMLKSYSVEAEIKIDFSNIEDRTYSSLKLYEVIGDFLRNQLCSSFYSPQQLKILMKRVGGKPKKLQEDLLREINRGIDIVEIPSFSELFVLFQSAMEKLRHFYFFESFKLMENFLALAPFYKELKDIRKIIHPEKLAKAKRFADLFDKSICTEEDFDLLIGDGIFFLEAFDPSLMVVKPKSFPEGNLHYPNLLSVLKSELEPIILKARSGAAIFSRVAYDCRRFVREYQEQEEIYGHTDLLIQMKNGLKKQAFVDCVRSRYSAAIIDEFQDTDPIQWEIFSCLFASVIWKGHLHLVGDPKQSIYSFRQADIYTYLAAAEALGSESIRTLQTNFRSQPLLIDALNVLFSSLTKAFFLPKILTSIPYRMVNGGRKEGFGKFCDGKEPLEFWLMRNTGATKYNASEIEEYFLLPQIVSKILDLNRQNGVGFERFAILIADRFQADRVVSYLKSYNIPVRSQKNKKINDSVALDEMRDLLKGILYCRSRSPLNIALAGRLIGFNDQELSLLNSEDTFFEILEKIDGLKKKLCHESFSKFYEEFMKSIWHKDGMNVLEKLLSEKEGLDFYREWEDLSDLLVEEQYRKNLNPEGLLDFLDYLRGASEEDDESLKAYVDLDEEGVSVLTTHISKGLEFDIVFALGLVKRTKEPSDTLIPLEMGNEYVLHPLDDRQDPVYSRHCEESDAEKMRQLYVALTRAREKVYVPVVVNESKKIVPKGVASPIELFLARLERCETDYSGLYERVFSEDGSTLIDFVDRHSDKMKLLILEDVFPFQLKPYIRFDVNEKMMNPPNKVKVPGSLFPVYSFTSLATLKNFQVETVIEDFALPHDFMAEDKTEYTLPAGAETGILLHKIFEEISLDSMFEWQGSEELRSFIAPFVQGTAFALWEDVLSRMVFKALKIPLDRESQFCLADVDPKKVYREAPFFYSSDLLGNIIEGSSISKGFLKGVADVFFEHGGRYYLVDWKSNWLGPRLEEYRKEKLIGEMKANQYDLQARIYCEAFRRYLDIFNLGDFEKIFGGVYFLFLRGLSSDSGVLHLSGSSLKWSV